MQIAYFGAVSKIWLRRGDTGVGSLRHSGCLPCVL